MIETVGGYSAAPRVLAWRIDANSEPLDLCYFQTQQGRNSSLTSASVQFILFKWSFSSVQFRILQL